MAGELGPEGLHERRRPGSRDAEELLEIAAGEEVAVERSSWRMASGMARSHRGVAGIGERRVGYTPCGACEVGRDDGAHTVRYVSRRSSNIQAPGGSG